MRKWIFCLIFGLLFNAFSNDEPVLEVKTTVTTTAKATNAYVAFLVRGQGLLIRKNKKAPSEDTVLPKVLFLYPVADYEYPQQL